MADNTSLEQLIIPYVPRIQGHFAESDIKKLYSMGVYDGDPAKFNPNEIITKRKVSKAEAAAFINQMIDYLRHSLKLDYQEKILM